ncbi:MAG: c-type cytochrome [Saprospiraceae bacterium]|nr:c-type cytochrome [Saprospiraceae bacterium]
MQSHGALSLRWKWMLVVCCLLGCTDRNNETDSFADRAANKDVAEYMQRFAGRGALTDESPLTSISQALSAMQIADDLKVDVVLAEPEVTQPLEINFDPRGRIWVVQYGQYPYPKGLKVTGIDHHIRMTFDKKPAPPPAGVRGADKITIFEDSDGDGTYDTSTDAITGLNIATAVTWGRGKIWVLNPPYLLAYPDPDGDGLPNGDPVVHADGFGLEDTHAVANSLRWGPDGWLYGAQGSTTTAVINTKNSKDVGFLGQAIWRYHPQRQIFEVFAEGGGNTFHVEIDAKGRIYSGTNGITRGQYYKQGAYYTKNWGKHGALTNSYAFGYLPDMDFTGEKIRFTHAWIKYEGGALPAAYEGKMFAINPLQNYIQLSRLELNGSTFATFDEGKVLATEDRWFRPVDIKAGPDGAIYLADWCDSRLSHVDPKDTWHKQSGRIYRITGKDSPHSHRVDLTLFSSDSLVSVLSHENKWHRQQALRLLGDRQDASTHERLTGLLQTADGQTALEALWALYVSGGWSDDITSMALSNQDPHVRMWAVRLCADLTKPSATQAQQLLAIADVERHPEVLSQLAATAKRVEPDLGLALARMISDQVSKHDADNPMMLWWGFEPHIAGENHEYVVRTFARKAIWSNPVIKEVVLSRMMQKLILKGEPADHELAAVLFEQAPSSELGGILMNGLLEGLRGGDVMSLPQHLLLSLKPFQASNEGELAMSLRSKDPETIAQSLDIIRDGESPLAERLSYIKILGQLAIPTTVSGLLDVMRDANAPPTILKTTLSALNSFEQDSIARQILDDYPNHLRADEGVRLAALYTLVSRESWATQLLERIQYQKEIHKEDFTHQIVSQLKLIEEETFAEAVNTLWPGTRLATDDEKEEQIIQIKNAVTSYEGSPAQGKVLYGAICGTCHKLFDEGSEIGPALTGYDRQNVNYLALHIVDPNIDIREGYVNYEVQTKDGRVFTGIIRNRTANEVRLKPVGGEAVTISSDQIQEIRPLPISIMPEKLISGLSDEQVADLFAYIMSQPQ